MVSEREMVYHICFSSPLSSVQYVRIKDNCGENHMNETTLKKMKIEFTNKLNAE
jgi:hypothetical protein